MNLANFKNVLLRAVKYQSIVGIGNEGLDVEYEDTTVSFKQDEIIRVSLDCSGFNLYQNTFGFFLTWKSILYVANNKEKPFIQFLYDFLDNIKENNDINLQL